MPAFQVARKFLRNLRSKIEEPINDLLPLHALQIGSKTGYYSINDPIFAFTVWPARALTLTPTRKLQRSLFSSYDGAIRGQFLRYANIEPDAHRMKGTSLLALDQFTDGNMCHAICDQYYRYWLAVDYGLEFEKVIFSDKTWEWARFVIEKILRPKHEVVYLKENRRYSFENLIIRFNSFEYCPSLDRNEKSERHPNHSAYSRFLLELRSSIRSFTSNNATNSYRESNTDKLFISRKTGLARSFENQKAIEDCFSNFGFEVLLLEEMTIEEQLKTMYKRTHIAGFHGAGLLNILGASNDAKIMELFSLYYWPRYVKIFSDLGNSYTVVDNSSELNPRILDLKALEEKLDAWV